MKAKDMGSKPEVPKPHKVVKYLFKKKEET